MIKQNDTFRMPSIIAAVLIFTAAVVITIALCMAAFSGNSAVNGSVLALFGQMMFGAYGWSSFLLPFHIIAAAVIVLFPGCSVRSMLMILFSLFPFYSAVAAERLLGVQSDNSFMRILGTGGICFLACVVIGIEYTAAWFASGALAAFISSMGKTDVSTVQTADISEPAADTDVPHGGQNDNFPAEDLQTGILSDITEIDDTIIETDDKPVTDDDIIPTENDETDTNSRSETVSPTASFEVPPILKSREVFNRIFQEHKTMNEQFGSYVQEAAQDIQYDDVEEYHDPVESEDISTEIPDNENREELSEDSISAEQESDNKSVINDYEMQEDDRDQSQELNQYDEQVYAEQIHSTTAPFIIDDAEELQPEQEEEAPVITLGTNEHRPMSEYEAILECRPFAKNNAQSDDEESYTIDDDENNNTVTDDFNTDSNDTTNNSIDDFGADSDDAEIEEISNITPHISEFDDEPEEDNENNSPTLPDYDTDIEDVAGDSSQDDADIDSIAENEIITDTVVPAEPAPAKPEKRRPSKKYTVPAADLLTSYPDGQYWVIDNDTRTAAAILKETLNEFKIDAEVTGIRKGPVITMFEILPAPGVKLQKIAALQDNIALRLAASSIRIIAPIPGKHAVGIEVPNKDRAIVSFREMIESEPEAAAKMAIPVVLGKDITGGTQYIDLATTPHLLIAGSTGAGKSVCVNSMILSILYKRSPADVRMILIDPKIVELKLYNDIPHLLTPVITEPKRAFQALQYCLCEMERRYAMLDGMGVRDIKSYNLRIAERHIAAEKLPYIVVIIDEFADLMATTGKELESTIARLAAMSRAVGIHLVLATQRPSIDVITGLIKANIPSRIAFMVASKTDSRIIIDQVGAEKLLGKGDMLYAASTSPFPDRIQGAFVTDNEVEKVAEYVRRYGEPDYIDDEIFYDEEDEDGTMTLFGDDGDDPLYEKALEIVMQAGKASASYIQRRLKIGYNRAARLVEEMELRGIVGPANGSKPRDVLHPM